MRGPRRSPSRRSPVQARVIALAAACATALAGCSTRVFSPYQMEVQQGNFVTQKEVGLLREGMTREQVRFVMGTPLVTDLFRVDRWDYVYTRQPENSDRSEKRRVTVHFDGDLVKRLEDVNVPPASETRPGQTAAAR
jgi:outer membrane protein assembly factor BamE